MERVSTSTNDAALAAYGAGPNAPAYFTDGNPGVADGTIPGAQWCNQVQEELVNAIEDDGAASDVTLDDQLATRISPLKGIKTHATDTGSVGTTHARAIIAASSSQASGLRSLAVASFGAVASGVNSFVAACDTAVTANGTASAIIACSTGAGATATPGGGAVAVASSDVSAGGSYSAVVASIGSDTSIGTQNACLATRDSLASGSRAIVAASDNSDATGDQAACLGTTDSTASGDDSAAVACDFGQPSGTQSATLACRGDAADPVEVQKVISAAVGCAGSRVATTGGADRNAVLLASKWCELADDYVIAAGYGPEAESAAGGTDWTYNGTNQHLTFKVDVTTGNGYFDGVADLGAADYAELFENATPGVLPTGALVTREGRKVRVAGPGDRVLGAVSAVPGIVGNGSALRWAGKFQTDQWGRVLRDEVPMVKWPRITRPTAGRLLAEGALSAARETYRTAAEAVDAARLTKADKARCLTGPHDAARAAWDALCKASGSRRPKRTPANAHLWHAWEDADAVAGAADRGMRELVAERKAAAVAALEAAELRVRACETALAPHRRAVEVEREGYDGRLDRAPQPIPEDAERYTMMHRRIAEGYDARRPYVARKDRLDEWTVVGLLGQIRVAVDSTVKPDDYVVPGEGGIGTSSAKPGKGRPVECMEIVSPGIALCMVG